jgi:hypothetical protein
MADVFRRRGTRRGLRRNFFNPVHYVPILNACASHWAKEGNMARKRGRLPDGAVGTELAKDAQIAGTDEDTVPAANDTVLAAEDNVPEAEIIVPAAADIVPITEEISVVPPAEEIQSGPDIQLLASQPVASQSSASIVEETVAAATVDPVAGIIEAALAEDFEVLEKLGKEGLKEAETVASSISGSFQLFATEAADYSKKCLESRAAFVGALLGAKSFESAVQFQVSYAKTAHARFLAHLVKMSGLYWKYIGEASKPIEILTARRTVDRAKS